MTERDTLIPFPGGGLSLPDHLIPARPVNTPHQLELRRKLAERERRGSFVLGPIALGWIKACQEAHPGALALALAIRAAAKMRGSAVPIGEALGKRIGLGRDSRKRALAALETAGLALVERQLGRAPRATLAPWPRP